MATSATLERAILPDDPEVLKQMVRERDRRIAQLEHYLVLMRRWQFGTRSERICEEQLLLGFAGKLESAPPPAAPPLPATAPKPRRRGRRPIPPEIPRQITVHDVPEGERACPRCGRERQCIGHDETTRLEYKPAQFFQDVHLKKKYVCRPCEGEMVTAAGPALLGPTERGLPGPGLLAHVLVSKFADHIPLYRQSRIYERAGMSIPRSTLCDWEGQAVGLLRPIVGAMTKDVLSAGIVRTDDTVVRLLEPGVKRGRSRQARLWGYMGNGQVVYQFTPTREQKWPLGFLKDFRGYVQADAYNGYDELFAAGSGRSELGCWAHARRYFVRAEETDPEMAKAAIDTIRLLYRIEEEGRDLSSTERAALRRQKAAPILEKFQTWLEHEALSLLPQSPMYEAVRYALKQWKALTRYVEVGEADIDNNAMERGLRGVALGRKNYLHFASEEGGGWGAVAYSLVESCKLNGVEPWAYLKDVLMRVWTHPADRIAELMPRRWKPPPPDTS